MNQSQNIIQWLRQLTQLEAEVSRATKTKKTLGELPEQIESVRNLLPTAILSHHDALKVRGRRSVAPAHNGVCGGCHLTLPRGTALDLRRTRTELTVCNNCGIFLYLSEEDQQQAPAEAVTKTSTTRKKAGKKAATATAA